ncbi:hypothetical protein SAMN05446037_100510 [Anaerovirgula multivorans]|uniref:Normocyte binding protein 2b n=1 Tax=Anaerovirgula multivorans TaxID=312168 RepID=A0A239C537_9FIRM|nr:hypothetical protein [Anaerovirgula multivorans]SNS15220.1 hypothetical protein SAMN05446037_100510 [Anaerovirgula multivorans]
MKEKIYFKINHIENLKDRALLKELLNEVIIPLYEHSEGMYNSLEKRVFDEIEYAQQNYSIYTTIVKKQDFDPIHYFLHPMLEEDIEDKAYDLQYILNTMLEKKEVNMFKIFLKCDYLIFKDILTKNTKFKGKIKTDKTTYDAYFKVKENKQYWDQVYRLYQIFIRNNIPWSTINAPYISRVADVFMVEYEDGITKGETIQEVNVDFGEYSKYVEYDIIPVWNIEKLLLESTGFPRPCEDKVNFEHDIPLKGEGAEHGYLIEHESKDINSIRCGRDTLFITTQTSDLEKWCVLKVIKPKESKLQKYNYELVSNSKKVSFIEKLSGKRVTNIKTKAELIRIINSFEISTYLDFKDIEIVDKEENSRKETYNMNFFILDEVRDSDYGKKMILYFTPKQESFIIRDLLSFIVSEIQFFYPEYKCEGRLI